MKNRVFPEQLRRELDIADKNIGDVLSLDGRQQAFLVLQTVKRFCYSADEQLSIHHVVPCGKLVGVPRECRQELDEWVLATAQKVWAMMTSSRDRMPLGHDGYQKVWSLQAPILSCEYLLLDEAQDTNEVVLGVLRRQKCQIVYVGDPHQQIYSWRGAVNAMDSLPATSEAALTQSFRFGPEIAAAATKVLTTLGEKRAIQGNPSRTSTILHDGAARTVLARTNAAVFAEVMECLGRRMSVCVVGGTAELGDLVADVKGLQRGRPAKQPELFGFRKWVDVVDFSKSEEGSELRRLVGLVGQHGVGKLEDAVQSTHDSEADADRIISTAHKAKGREWRDVRLVPGFAAAAADGRPLPREDVRLFYVAMTRASERLVVDREELDIFQSIGKASSSREQHMASHIVVQCRNGHRMKVPLGMGGKHGACSLCGAEVVVPTAAAAQDGTIRFACPNGHHMTVPGAMAGKQGRCSQCQADVNVPSITR